MSVAYPVDLASKKQSPAPAGFFLCDNGEMEGIPSDEILAGMHECRVLVLLESDDHTKFHQVLLNAAQFKKVSDTVIYEEKPDPTLKPGYTTVRLNMGRKEFSVELFEGMSSFVPQSELDAIIEEEDHQT